MTNQDDTSWGDLMADVQKGNNKAYAQLLQQIGPFVYGMIRGKINNPAIAEELYQTVLFNMHRARHTYDPDRAFKPWLYSITRNTVYDHLRKQRRRTAVEAPLFQEFDPVATPDTNAQESALLQKALATLPENQRDAVKMIKFDGLSMKEAAEKAGVSESAIKVRAHRGYEALKVYLTQQTEDKT